MRLQETASLAKRVREHLGERFVVLARPEHPYLLVPPDLLIGGEGLLTAVFSSNSAENRAPQMLRARLVATRLALPEHTRCVLLATRRFQSEIHGAAGILSQRDFEIVLSIDDPRGLSQIAASNSIGMPKLKELMNEKIQNAERSARALFLSEVAERFDSLAPDRSTDDERIVSWAQEIEFVLSRVAERGIPNEPAAQASPTWRGSRWLRQFHRGEQILMSARGR